MTRAIVPGTINPGGCAIRAGRSTLLGRGRCRGVVLLVALLVLAVLGLAAAALFRSVDTATLAAGNLAAQQAAVAAVDRGIEQAIHALWDAPDAITERTQHALAQNYYACIQGSPGNCLAAGSPIPDVPAMLSSAAAFTAAGLDETLVPEDAAGNTVRYVIERMCLASGAAVGESCNLASLPGDDAGTQHHGEAIGATDAFYRVTVMVTGPRNTVVYGQALLR